MGAAKKSVGRPAEQDAKRRAVMVRMTDDQFDLLTRMIDARNEELRVESVTVTAPDVLRWLLVKEGTARGLIKK